MAEEQLNLSDLGQQISDTFNTSELQNLCLDLGIDYEALPVPLDAAGKLDKVRALVLFCHRHGRLPNLLETLQEKRPSSNWQPFNHLAVSPPAAAVPIRSNGRSWWLGGFFVLVVLMIGLGWLWRRANSDEPEVTAVATTPTVNQIEEMRETAVPSPAATNPTTEPQTLSGLPGPTATPAPLSLSELNVSNTLGDSGNPNLLVDEANTLHFIWYDTTPQLSGAVLYRQRTVDGMWSDITNLTENFDYVGEYALQLLRHPDGQICAFWDTPGGSQAAGYYMRCLVDGTWSEPTRILSYGGASRDFRPAFAPDGTVHVIYINSDLLYGETQLSDGFQAVSHPWFVIDSRGVFHVVWLRQGQPFSLEYRSSSDNGQTWSEAERLTDDQSPADFPLSLLADTQGQVHLVWFANDMAYYRRWTAESGWQASVKILPRAIDNNSCGRVVLTRDSTDRLQLAFQGISGLFYLQQTDLTEWQPPRLITEDICDFDSPALAVDGLGNRHFVWNKQPDDVHDFYYALLPAGE